MVIGIGSIRKLGFIVSRVNSGRPTSCTRCPNTCAENVLIAINF